MIRATRYRKIRHGELRLNLMGVAPETVLLDLDETEVREALVKAVQHGSVETRVLEMFDGSGVPLAVLEALGYGASDLAKAESRVRDALAKSATERALAPVRRKGRVEIDEEEHTRLRKLEDVVRKFLQAGGH